jgi:hypothetical protein
MKDQALRDLRRDITRLPRVRCQISIKQHSDGNEVEVGAISAAHFGRATMPAWRSPGCAMAGRATAQRRSSRCPRTAARHTASSQEGEHRDQLRRLAMVEAQQAAEAFSPRHRRVVVGGCGERRDRPVVEPVWCQNSIRRKSDEDEVGTGLRFSDFFSGGHHAAGRAAWRHGSRSRPLSAFGRRQPTGTARRMASNHQESAAISYAAWRW